MTLKVRSNLCSRNYRNNKDIELSLSGYILINIKGRVVGDYNPKLNWMSFKPKKCRKNHCFLSCFDSGVSTKNYYYFLIFPFPLCKKKNLKDKLYSSH